MAGWQNKPFKIDVKAGDTKAYCMCGLSKNGPFCDGSHASTDITPNVVSYDEDKAVFACGCKQSGNRPYCDGSHTKIKDAAFPNVSNSEKPVEDQVSYIQELAKNGLSKVGHHGPMGAMGVPRRELPSWDDIQFVTAQLSKVPLLDDEKVDTKVVIGPNAKKPLEL
ncbi:MAG: CDGSH iron-sulfur domain-containing protein, partial [Emcibacteraceae bacterium]|nr:CDGSH iron-sulfur domain-containing protein [Emcibacteraceae bacterium]